MLWDTRPCHIPRPNDLKGHSNFSSTIHSFSIRCLEHHYCGDQQWRSLTPKLNKPSAFVYFRWSWSCYLGLVYVTDLLCVQDWRLWTSVDSRRVTRYQLQVQVRAAWRHHVTRITELTMISHSRMHRLTAETATTPTTLLWQQLEVSYSCADDIATRPKRWLQLRFYFDSIIIIIIIVRVKTVTNVLMRILCFNVSNSTTTCSGQLRCGLNK